MKLEEKQEKTLWLNNPNTLSTLILLIIFLIFVSNQSYIASGNTKEIISNVVNNNTIFILVFIYFACLKFKFGKKNFKLTSLYVFLIIMLVTVIWQYSLLLLFFVAFAYSFLLNEVPSEGKSPSNSSSDNSSVGIGVSSKKIAGGYYGA